MRFARTFWVVLGLTAFASCAGIQSRYHEVRSGEDLNQIARRYDVPLLALRRSNGESLASGLKPGSKLYIPFESSPHWENPGMEEESSPAHPDAVPVREVAAVHFSWPVAGSITSLFGKRRGERHEGIDIAARKGTPVRAARSGHVIYASNKISGYGNMIIVRHTDTFSTVYAHLDKYKKKKGDFITRGEILGLVGRTGRATGSHLHFEVRDASVAVDPLLYLHGQYANNKVR